MNPDIFQSKQFVKFAETYDAFEKNPRNFYGTKIESIAYYSEHVNQSLEDLFVRFMMPNVHLACNPYYPAIYRKINEICPFDDKIKEVDFFSLMSFNEMNDWICENLDYLYDLPYHELRKINEKDLYGNTALMIACYYPFKGMKIINFLLFNDVYRSNVNLQNFLGQTAFHIACQTLNMSAIDFLVNNRYIDLKIRDKNGYTGLDILIMKPWHKNSLQKNKERFYDVLPIILKSCLPSITTFDRFVNNHLINHRDVEKFIDLFFSEKNDLRNEFATLMCNNVILHLNLNGINLLKKVFKIYPDLRITWNYKINSVWIEFIEIDLLFAKNMLDFILPLDDKIELHILSIMRNSRSSQLNDIIEILKTMINKNMISLNSLLYFAQMSSIYSITKEIIKIDNPNIVIEFIVFTINSIFNFSCDDIIVSNSLFNYALKMNEWLITYSLNLNEMIVDWPSIQNRCVTVIDQRSFKEISHKIWYNSSENKSNHVILENYSAMLLSYISRFAAGQIQLIKPNGTDDETINLITLLAKFPFDIMMKIFNLVMGRSEFVPISWEFQCKHLN